MLIRTTLAVSILGSAAVAYFLYVTPGSPWSIAAFKAGYAIAPDKQAYLWAYSPRRRDVGSGAIPPPVDRFLCSTLEAALDTDEIWAIVNFYVLQGMRSGECLASLSLGSRQKVIATTAERIASIDDFEGMALVVEQVRTARHFCKGGVSSKRGYAYHPDARSQLRQPLVSWLKRDLPVADKLKLDPFADTDVKIYDGCM